MNDSRGTAELDHLINEMERMDEDLARHLAAEFEARSRAGAPLAPIEFARLQIRAWCAQASRQGAYDAEVIGSMAMAVDTMGRQDLAALIRSLAFIVRDTPRRPAA